MSTPAQSGSDRAVCDSALPANFAVPGIPTRVAWFYDPPSRGSWNMALDEALLLRAVEAGLPALRFYEWDEPTLSLGYFQRYADRASHEPSIRCPLVRRTTGGGAILHDRELTYSCALPSAHWLARRSADLYYAIHESIVAVLAEFGFAAGLQDCDQSAADASSTRTSDRFGCSTKGRGADSNARGVAHQPFLCFERRSAGDIILKGQKVVGSAQRRCRGAVLQHGSILLAKSGYAPELPGIRDLGDFQIETRDLAERLRAALTARLHFDFVVELPSNETRKFTAEAWRSLR
jgi:lipoate-protein ligase A